ncbi:MAG: response regulator [Lachnospiraceae bacterium]|nr:response regulator [Lachnospiraceae bacterium]
MSLEEMNILVVEDTAINLKTIVRLLQKKGVQADGVASGKECLALIKEKHFDLIFMDYLMPEMDGVETFRQMQAQEHLCKETPVVMLTAVTDGGAKEEFEEMGFSDYLGKPVLPPNLYAIVEKYCK